MNQTILKAFWCRLLAGPDLILLLALAVLLWTA